jgi:predicted SnoaL-like aldol condensation-catalyzing enzyme
VLEAFDTLFNKRNYAEAEKFWSPNYIQHSAHIPPGRDGLFNLIMSSPPSLKYENQLTLANGDFVMLHGRYSGRWCRQTLIRSQGFLKRGRLRQRCTPR